MTRLAGILDPEGWISILKTNNRIGVILQLGVGNTNPLLIQWLKETFGGNTYARNPQVKGRKPCFVWRVYGAAASGILLRARNFLILKRSQADLALVFQSKMHSKSW